MQTADANILDERRHLRKQSLERRAALSESERASFSARIADKVFDALTHSQVKLVHCYISFRDEVETHSLIERLLTTGIRVVVPVIDVPSGPRALIHTEIRHLRDLQKGAFGTDEPISRDAADLSQLHAVLIPVVAFDCRGTRLGYGKGFYDSFLSTLPVETKRIGLAFAVQEVPRIPELPHDVPLQRIVTESEDLIVRTT